MSAALIARHGRNVTRKAFAAGSYVRGHYVAGAATTSTIVAAVLPATAKDVLLLAEGDRTKEVVAFYTATAVQTKDETLKKSDTLTVDGKEYEVLSVKNYEMANERLRYFKALAVFPLTTPSEVDLTEEP